ncbi:MAG: cupin-like domain-containing protein [Gammaproteobacteria bacterium]
MQLQTLECRNDLSPGEFIQQYYLPQKPVVLGNFMQDWPAREKWNLDYLRRLAGHVPVNVYGSWEKHDPTRISRTPQALMSFAEYLDSLDGPDDGKAYRLFLFNLIKHCPQLREDFSFPAFARGWLKSQPFMFFGRKDADVRIHYDLDFSNVFLSQFQGAKRIWLFAPDQSRNLHRQPFSSHSNINVRRPDYEKFPRASGLQGYRCDLSHGQTLFMPSGYWHYVHYLSSGYSLALRSMAVGVPRKLDALRHLLWLKPVDDLMATLFEESWARYKVKKAGA